MRILLVHNYYQQPGGEDVVFANEQALLRSYGHEVLTYQADNHELKQIPAMQAAIETIWSAPTYRKFVQILQQTQPDVVHFHNTFMRISPAAYYACHHLNLPVVQTLHNYRLLCPAATFYRDGQLCEACLHHKVPLAAIRHACYRQSRSQSAIVAAMLATHTLLNTWHSQVDRYIALTHFAREKFIEGGLPADKLVVKPNFIDPDPGERTTRGHYALFVGRLTEEKGIRLLVEAGSAWGGIPVKIVGDGPLLPEMVAKAQSQSHQTIEFLGRQDRENTLALMKEAAFLIFPSVWYEGLPMTIIEAYACGLPVLAANRGAMTDIVKDGITGRHFEADNRYDLAQKVCWAWEHPTEMAAMGKQARRQYERLYSAPQNYEQLLRIYQQASEACRELHPRKPYLRSSLSLRSGE